MATRQRTLRKAQITKVQSARRTLASIRHEIEHGLVVPPVGEERRPELLIRLLDAADEILSVVATEEFLTLDVLFADTQKLLEHKTNAGDEETADNTVNS